MLSRKEQIAEAVNRMGQIDLAQLRNMFPGVSDVTLRKDLRCLDEEKRIIRVHGGAKSIFAAVSTLDTHYTRLKIRMKEKEIVAKKAVSLLREQSSVYIAPGSTCYALVQKMPDIRLNVFTDGLLIANELRSFKYVKVTLLGGTLDKDGARTTGPMVQEALNNMSFDCAFIGVDGYHPQRGFIHYMEHTAAICRQLTKRSDQVVALMDASKLENTRSSYVLPTSAVDVIVSDRELPPDVQAALRSGGVDIL